MNDRNNNWKNPHKIKILEACSVIADKRYEKKGDCLFIYSSDYKKRYTVEKYNDGYASNDNMSYNNGILGYPIVVNLILEGKIHINIDVAILFKGINWTSLNEKCSKDFTLSYEIVMGKLEKQGVNIEYVRSEINDVYEQLLNLIPTIAKKEGKFCYEDSFLTLKDK